MGFNLNSLPLECPLYKTGQRVMGGNKALFLEKTRIITLMNNNLIPPQPLPWTNPRAGAGTALVSKTMSSVVPVKFMLDAGRMHTSLILPTVT